MNAGTVSLTGPDVLELIGRASLSALDGHNAGRYMPPRMQGVGSGCPRRFTVVEAAVTWACVDFGCDNRAAAKPGVTIAAHLHGCDRLPRFAVWTARDRYLFTDDAVEVARVCNEHGGGRVINVDSYVTRVRNRFDPREEEPGTPSLSGFSSGEVGSTATPADARHRGQAPNGDLTVPTHPGDTP